MQRRSALIESLEQRNLLAGPYAPAANVLGSTAIDKDNSAIVAWATAVDSYTAGTNVDAEFQVQANALGPASDEVGNTVSLGRGGQITIRFDAPIRDGLGDDFAVFENGFSDTFLELGYVEVSSDGVNFVRFESDSLTPDPVDAFGAVDPTEVNNLAGKYRIGFGTPFDLEELAGIPSLDTTRVTHVRIVDIVGDGSATDASGDVIYDPFPTVGSAGFDLDAVGVLHQAESAIEVASFEDVGQSLTAQTAFIGPVPDGNAITGPFNDSVIVGEFTSEDMQFNNAFSQDFGSWNGWGYSNATDTTTPGFANQISSFAGGGANDTPTFGIGFQDLSGFYALPTLTRDPSDNRALDSIMVTNTTYTALSVQNGDQFAKKFGGDSGNDPDFLRLTIDGKDANGTSIGKVDFFLADYRFADNSQDFIVDQWMEVDLSSIANARSLEFSMDSSDVGQNGINTPLYFAVDEIAFAKPQLAFDIADREISESGGATATMARVSRPNQDTTTPITVTLNTNSNDIEIPSSVTIEAGRQFVEFAIGVEGNDLVDGDRSAQITATAASFESSSNELTVQDDDVLTLTTNFTQVAVDEGASVDLVITRNDANLNQILPLEFGTDMPDSLTLPEQVVIQAGQSSVTVNVTAVADEMDGPDIDATIEIAAADYAPASVNVTIRDTDSATVSVLQRPALSEDDSTPEIGFEDVGRTLAVDSFYNGADLAGGFESGALAFSNSYNPNFGSWSGWAYSNTTDTETPGFLNQYSAFTSIGADGTETYAVASTFSPTTITRAESTLGFESIEITNTTYAALSMMQGDTFAKKFGGENGDDPDFFLLTINGRDADGETVGAIEFYLADFRFEDNSLDYIIDEWTTVDLSPIGGAVELEFSLSSSDVGMFGMNTPAYFAADQVRLVPEVANPTITVTRNTLDTSQTLDVSLASSDESELIVPAVATIPAGRSSVQVPVMLQDDALADGDQIVTVSVQAAGHTGTSADIVVEDNDSQTLVVTALTKEITEGSQAGRLLVHRNGAEISEPLDIVISIIGDDQDLLTFSSTTIPADERRLEVEFSASDNDDLDDDQQVEIQVTATGWMGDTETISIMNDDFPPPALDLELDVATLSESDAQPIASFEDVGYRLLDESFYNGSDFAGGFDSGAVSFNNTYESTFGSWGGWSVSNTTDVQTPGFGNQYSAITGAGAGQSSAYAVANAFPGGLVPTLILDPSSNSGFESLMITNTTYAALSLRDGDTFAKQFGGETGDDPDFFMLQIEGKDAAGESVGTIDFYLADYRFDDNTQDFIVDQWTEVNLSSLAGAVQLEFFLSSSDVGSFGMNTPAYFAVDNIVLTETDPNTITATVARNDSDLTEELVVDLSAEQSSHVVMPDSVEIPAGEASATFQIRSYDDFIVDGDVDISIMASAETHESAMETVRVIDNDQPSLMSALTRNQILESAGESASELIIYRNTDTSEPLTVSIATSDGASIQATAIIPAGERVVSLPIEVLDDDFVDGNQTVQIEVTADGFAQTDQTLSVLDDETAGIVVSETDGTTELTEAVQQDEVSISLASKPQSDVDVVLESLDERIQFTATRLTFTPENWDVSQNVGLSAMHTWAEEDPATVEVSVGVDPAESDAAFADVSVALQVGLNDFQSERIRLTEDESRILVLDDPVDGSEPTYELQSTPHSDGISIVANSLSQTIVVGALEQASGLIQIDASGGDDTVVMQGTRFTSLSGGAGFDRLIVSVEGASVNLVDLLDNRIGGFEEIIIDSPHVDEVVVEADRLGQIIGDGVRLQLNLGSEQVLSIIGPATSEDPMLVDGEFAQVIGSNDAMMEVVSDNHWQNLINPLDVDRSGSLSPFDALVVLNALSDGITDLLPLTELEEFAGAFYDVSGEGTLSPFDALLVLNQLAEEVRLARQTDAMGEQVVVQRGLFSESPVDYDQESLYEVPDADVLVQREEIADVSIRDTAIREVATELQFGLEEASHENGSAETDLPPLNSGLTLFN